MANPAAHRVLIVGNSGCGKSTLAKRLSGAHACAHLDLDTHAWQPTTPPQRMGLDNSARAIEVFTAQHDAWVIEGCYTDLLELVAAGAQTLVLLDLSIQSCQDNARTRPWEPHKYASKAEQDKNLEMLLEWIAQYTQRTDTFSHTAHNAFFERFSGAKYRLTSNLQSAAFELPGSA